MKNIVDDSQGMILATKSGNLRLVKWIQGKVVTTLVEVPMDLNDTAPLAMTSWSASGQNKSSCR